MSFHIGDPVAVSTENGPWVGLVMALRNNDTEAQLFPPAPGSAPDRWWLLPIREPKKPHKTYEEWLKGYRVAAMQALRGFGIEKTPDEIDTMVQEAIVQAIRDSLVGVVRRTLEGRRG